MPEVDRGSLLRVLYLSIFLTSTGLGTSTFLLPVYAETLGATYLDLGRIGAAGNLVYFLGTLVTGFLLERYERVSLYLVFTLGGAATIFLFSFADSIPLITLMRLLLGLFSAAFWVTASTLTAASSRRATCHRQCSQSHHEQDNLHLLRIGKLHSPETNLLFHDVPPYF